jgi:hypothetical protein
MKNVKLKFNDTSVDVFDDGWLCICDGENQIFLRPEYFKKLLEALTIPVVVGQSEQLKCRCIKEEINKNSSDMKNLKEQFLEILEDDHTPSIEKADKLLVLFGVSTRTFHVGDKVKWRGCDATIWDTY